MQAVIAVLPTCLVVGYLFMLSSQVPDLAAYYKAQRAASPDLAFLLKMLTNWGNPIFYVVYATILFVGWKKQDKTRVRFALTYLIVQLVISFALVRMLKITLGCPRPGVGGPCIPFSFDGGHNGLPSGHTVEITGATVPLAMRWGKVIISFVLGCFIALLAFSRVYLGWHSPVDVAFGLAFGLFAALLIHSYGRSS